MRFEPKDTTLLISEISELTSGFTAEFKDRTRQSFSSGLKDIDLDCATLDFLDSSGLGALVSIQKLAVERGGKLRLLAPKPPVVQVLELTRLNRIFEIVAA